MPKLVGIPGIKKEQVNCQSVSSITELFRVLKPKLAAIAAGDNGSLSVYVGDGGEYRCDFHRYGIKLGEGQFNTKKEVRAWLIKWWPALGDQQRLAMRMS